jgi:hypothetical protein
MTATGRHSKTRLASIALAFFAAGSLTTAILSHNERVRADITSVCSNSAFITICRANSQ